MHNCTCIITLFPYSHCIKVCGIFYYRNLTHTHTHTTYSLEIHHLSVYKYYCFYTGVDSLKYQKDKICIHLCVLVSISSRRMKPRLVRMERPRIAMIHVITGLQKMYVPMSRATPVRVCGVGEEEMSHDSHVINLKLL